MIVPSPEIAAIARRFVAAAPAADGRTQIGLLLDSEHLRYIGSAPGETWAGAAVRAAMDRHLEEIPPFETRFGRIEAFENGDTGWAEVHAEVIFEDRAPRPVRHSFVFVLQDGHWKAAQCHISFPVANEEVGGFEHRAIGELLVSLEAGDLDPGDEGMATIMFTDIADSTALASALGDRMWARVISRHLDAVSAAVEAEGGKVVKTLGDGMMSSFPATARALRTAIAAQRTVEADDREPRLRMRVGVHTGDVIRTGGDVFGTVVNKAARVAAAAAPGDILVSDAARAMASGAGFAFGPAEAVNIRGLEGESLVSRLEWREPA